MEFIIGNAGVHVPEDNDPNHGGGPIRRSPLNVTRSGSGMPPYGYPEMVQRTPHQVVRDAEPGQGYWPGRVTRMKYLPDGRMVRAGGMGGGVDPFDDTIKEIIRKINAAPCITAQQWLPLIRNSMEFASDSTPYPFAWWKLLGGVGLLLIPDDARARARTEMKKRWYTLEYWYKRFSAETSTSYCGGYTVVNGKKITSQDKWLITQAIVGPYIEASGYIAEKRVLNEALRDLLKTLTINLPSEVGSKLKTIAIWTGVGAGVLILVAVAVSAIRKQARGAVADVQEYRQRQEMSGDFGRLARTLAKHAVIRQLGRYMP